MKYHKLFKKNLTILSKTCFIDKILVIERTLQFLSLLTKGHCMERSIASSVLFSWSYNMASYGEPIRTLLNDVYVSASSAIRVIASAVGLASDATQGDPANDTTVQTSHEAKDFDGSALPNAVDEGDAVRPAASLSGVAYTMPVNKDGSKSPVNSSGYFDVEIQADNAGLAKESGGVLDTIAGDTTSIDGKITACNTGAIAGSVTANAGTNLNTSALALESGGNLDTIAGDTTSIDGKITACNTGAVVVASGAITETNSGDIKTAVEKIDDLQGALKSVDTDEIVTRVTDSTGAEINPAEEDGNLATVATDTTAISGVSGTTADAANTTGTTGTLSGKLRGLVQILADVWDSVSNVLKVQEQSPLPEQYTDPVTLVTASDIGAVDDTWKDQGQIATGGKKTFTLWVSQTVNDSTGNQLQLLALHTSGGTQYIEEIEGEYQKTLGDANITGIRYHYDLKHTTPYVLVQTKATLLGATEGTVTISYTMGVL